MNKYFAHISCGNGMKDYLLIEAEGEEEAEEDARQECIDLADSYGYEQDLDHFGDNDQLGKDWDEEEEEYGDTQELEYWVELYDPEEHDDYLN